MAQTVTSTKYNGEFFRQLLRATVQPAETVEAGLVAVQSGINKALFLPKTALSGNIMQDYDPSGVDSGSVGTFTTTDTTTLNIVKQSVKINNIDPNDWRLFSEEFAPSASELYSFTELPPVVRDAYVMELLERTADITDQNIWTGSRATAASYPTDRFNGLLTLLDAAGDFVDATPSGAAALSASNVEAAFLACYEALFSSLAAVEARRRRELRFVVSKTTATYLQTAERNISGKGLTFLNMQGVYDLTYNGIPIVPLSNFPDNRIVLSYFDRDPMRGNAHFGITNVDNHTSINMGKMANGSLYDFMRMDFAAGTQWSYTNEVISWKTP